MGKRKVSILEPAATAAAEIAWFIESKGLPPKAKKFVIDAYDFFDRLSKEKPRKCCICRAFERFC
jgi:hypothetical protein